MLRALRGTVLLSVAIAAGCGGAQGEAHTRVARVEEVRTDVPEYRDFFRSVRSMQIAINEAERVRTDLLARLVADLALAETAGLDACVSAVHERVERLRAAGVRVAFEVDENAQPLPGADAAPSQAAVEGTVRVDAVASEGTIPDDARRWLDAARLAIRSALALEKRMELIAAGAAPLREAGARLAATVNARAPARAAELRAEFRDALDFLDGAAARARAYAQVAGDAATRLRASAAVREAEARPVPAEKFGLAPPRCSHPPRGNRQR